MSDALMVTAEDCNDERRCECCNNPIDWPHRFDCPWGSKED